MRRRFSIARRSSTITTSTMTTAPSSTAAFPWIASTPPRTTRSGRWPLARFPTPDARAGAGMTALPGRLPARRPAIPIPDTACPPAATSPNAARPTQTGFANRITARSRSRQTGMGTKQLRPIRNRRCNRPTSPASVTTTSARSRRRPTIILRPQLRATGIRSTTIHS